MELRKLFTALLLVLSGGIAHGASELQQVQIADPYIDLRTGPGFGYPIYFAVSRSEWITILERRGDLWFHVRDANGQDGWVHRQQLELTLSASGEQTTFHDITQEEFSNRRWELGIMGGEFDGATVSAGYAGYAITDKLSGELAFSQAVGSYTTNYIISGNLLGQPFPKWRISPFFKIGAGYIRSSLRSTLVDVPDHDDQIMHVGLGARTFITRRFMLRVEYNSHVIFTSIDDNEDPEEWKAGFAVFF